MIYALPTADLQGHRYDLAAPVKYERTVAEIVGSLPLFGSAGTGGFEGDSYLINRHGYRPIEIIVPATAQQNNFYAPYADLMNEIRVGFGRTFSHLPAIFGVSRQTLYNWAAGEQPKEQHRAKLVQLSDAAKTFSEAGFKPTSIMLERTITKGKSFIELLRDGADGREIAQKLIRISQRGAATRDSLNALLGNRDNPRLEISDMGRRSFPDEA